MVEEEKRLKTGLSRAAAIKYFWDNVLEIATNINQECTVCKEECKNCPLE